MKTFLMISYCIISFSVIYAQNPEWINYTNGQNVTSVVIEGNNVWIGTTGGLVKLNKTTGEKTFFNKSNSGLPSNSVSSIAIDGLGNKWIGTYGLAKFDGTTWTVYTTSNSGLPDNTVNSIAIDSSGNKWIGLNRNGLSVFKEGGVVSVKEIPSKNIPKEFILFQNYPNPFNPVTNINFSLPAKSFVSLKVFDLIGREVATFVSQEKSAGTYQVTFNASRLPSGIYFYRLIAGTFTQAKKMLVLK